MDAKIKTVYSQALIEVSEFDQEVLNDTDRLKAEIQNVCLRICSENNILLNNNVITFIIHLVFNDIKFLGPLSLYINDPEVGDILVNGYDTIFIEKKGVVEHVESYFLDDNHVLKILRKALAYCGRTIDESSPIVDARLEGGIRLNAVIPPISLSGVSMSLRKLSLSQITFDRYIAMGTCSPEMAEVLKLFVHKRANIIVSGGTGSGKTTLLRLLASEINPADRIVTIEDAAELLLNNNNLVSLETRTFTTGVARPISAQDLVVNALRMRPERIIVGECRAGETFQMLQAMNTGHDGSMSSLHANNVREAVVRIESMVLMSGVKIPHAVVKTMIAGSVDAIIQISKKSDGKRVIENISQVIGIDNDKIVMHEVSEYKNGNFIFNGLSKTGKFA